MTARDLKQGIIFLLTLNIADYLLTLHFITMGGSELNPLIRPIIDTPAGAVVKRSVGPLILALLWHHRGRIMSSLRLRVPLLAVITSYTMLIVYFAFGLSFGKFY